MKVQLEFTSVVQLIVLGLDGLPLDRYVRGQRCYLSFVLADLGQELSDIGFQVSDDIGFGVELGCVGGFEVLYDRLQLLDLPSLPRQDLLCLLQHLLQLLDLPLLPFQDLLCILQHLLQLLDLPPLPCHDLLCLSQSLLQLLDLPSLLLQNFFCFTQHLLHLLDLPLLPFQDLLFLTQRLRQLHDPLRFGFDPTGKVRDRCPQCSQLGHQIGPCLHQIGLEVLDLDRFQFLEVLILGHFILDGRDFSLEVRIKYHEL